MNDTIAAIATGSGRSAIGIIRLSGPDAIRAVEEVFSPAAGKPMSQRPDRLLVYGTLRGGDGRRRRYSAAPMMSRRARMPYISMTRGRSAMISRQA